ncbi:MAG: transposase [Ramlibacter sp.]|nr:transposase [Ramlibacter sp.]
MLTEAIRKAHQDSDETYGMPRVRAELREAGPAVRHKRVARLMRQARIRGVSRRRGFTVTTERDRRQRPAPDLVNRRFHDCLTFSRLPGRARNGYGNSRTGPTSIGSSSVPKGRRRQLDSRRSLVVIEEPAADSPERAKGRRPIPDGLQKHPAPSAMPRRRSLFALPDMQCGCP